MNKIVGKLLCAVGIHDKVIVEMPRVHDEFKDLLEIVEGLSRRYTQHLSYSKHVNATTLVYNISKNRHSVVCIRDGCAYSKNFRALGLEKLKKLKTSLTNALEKRKVYEQKRQEANAAEQRIEAERKAIAAKKFGNLTREKGTLSFGEVDGSLSISDTAHLSVCHKERDK